MHDWRAIELPGRGRTYACDIAGPSRRAPVLVLLHGWLATGALNWRPTLEPLSRHFRVIAIDHRGHGRGMRGDDRFSLEHCADDAVALADVLGVKRFVPVGYSMGGPIAQLVWRRHPQRVDGLVLCSTFADLRVVGVPRFALPGRLPGWGTREWIAELRLHDPRAILEAARAIRRFSSTEWLAEIAVPTVVVVTERDQVVPPARQLMLAAGIRDAHTISLDADHGVCVTRPDEFADAVLQACLLVTDGFRRRVRRRLSALFPPTRARRRTVLQAAS